MPIPSLFFFALVTGVGSALAARVELRLNPRPALFTRSFASYALFMGFVMIPVAVYFYVFHGDWALFYLVDTARLPSALAMVGFMAMAAVGVLGFVSGATLVRTQREVMAVGIIVLALLLAIGVVVVGADRLSLVGSWDQFDRHYGLRPYGGAALQGTIVMSLLLAVGWGLLLVRMWIAGRRG